MSRSLKLYLEDILQSGNKVLNFTANMTLEELVRDERTFDAVAHSLQIIGKAPKNIPEEIRSQYAQVEWRKIAGLRDIIAHTYFSIDEQIIWDIIQNKLSIFLEQIQNILLNCVEE